MLQGGQGSIVPEERSAPASLPECIRPFVDDGLVGRRAGNEKF
jgi:hypothetical protein